jgi:hypothetical protein
MAGEQSTGCGWRVCRGVRMNAGGPSGFCNASGPGYVVVDQHCNACNGCTPPSGGPPCGRNDQCPMTKVQRESQTPMRKAKLEILATDFTDFTEGCLRTANGDRSAMWSGVVLERWVGLGCCGRGRPHSVKANQAQSRLVKVAEGLIARAAPTGLGTSRRGIYKRGAPPELWDGCFRTGIIGKSSRIKLNQGW